MLLRREKLMHRLIVYQAGIPSNLDRAPAMKPAGADGIERAFATGSQRW
jgi:hypothetical protein